MKVKYTLSYFPADSRTHNWPVNFGNFTIIKKNIFLWRYLSLECEGARELGTVGKGAYGLRQGSVLSGR